jgi:hypothetical protein
MALYDVGELDRLLHRTGTGVGTVFLHQGLQFLRMAGGEEDLVPGLGEQSADGAADVARADGGYLQGLGGACRLGGEWEDAKQQGRSEDAVHRGQESRCHGSLRQ